jgi:hypothetical protein
MAWVFGHATSTPRVNRSKKLGRGCSTPRPFSTALLPIGRGRCIDKKAMALSEHRDGAHVHLQPVLLPHGANRFLIERTLVRRWKQRS